MMFTDELPTRPYQGPPRSLPDATPRFFVGDDSAVYVEIAYSRNPNSRPVLAVTPEIAAAHPDEWAAFVAEQEATCE